MNKRCSKCGNTKNEQQFHKDARANGGRRPECIDCRYLNPDLMRKKRKKAKRIAMNVRLDEPTKRGLVYLSKTYNVSQSIIVERALTRYLADNLAEATRRNNSERKRPSSDPRPRSAISSGSAVPPQPREDRVRSL